MKTEKKKIEYIIIGALIAAAYVGLTFLSSAFSLAYGPVQLRLSEVLTLLPIFTPAAIPGVTIGCFIANIASFNLIDMIFGTLATLVAAILTYLFRNIKFKGIPLISMLPPIIINGVVIGFEIALFFLPEGNLLWGFVISGLEVALGEAIVCLVFGVPFYLLISRHNIFSERFK